MYVQNKFSTIFIALVITFSLVLGSFGPATASTASAITCSESYTVVRGDYLVKIARLYNLDWRNLAEINDLASPYKIYPGQVLCIATVSGNAGSGSTSGGTTTSSSQSKLVALSVEEDKSVTLQGKSLAANTRYSVYLSKYGSYPAGAYLVGSILTDKYGGFTATYNLPKRLVDTVKIAVNLTSTRGSAVSNWFINATSDGNTGGEGTPSLSFTVSSVNDDDWVKIKTSNLPANVTFVVRMGKVGTKGVDGVIVGTLRDRSGGSVRASFDIPDQLQGKSKIDLRLENKQLGISYYMTFEN